MFDALSEKFQSLFHKIRGYGTLSEQNVEEACAQVRRALLEADVHYKVARDFVGKVQTKAIGQEVLTSLTPGQVFTKIVYDELVQLLGSSPEVALSGNPALVMVVGLQGSGKTTACAKLAKQLHKKGRKPMLVAADIYRPAAVEQLRILAAQAGAGFFYQEGAKPLVIAQGGVEEARARGNDLAILDTAGRLHIDEAMMQELIEIKAALKPCETLLVADGMTGQDAVNIAREFESKLGVDGVILSKMDGDARGGAALSIRAITGRPIKFLGTGEKLDALEPFHADRMASRILGMGDVVSFVEKAQEAFDLKQAEKMGEKLRKKTFSFEDFLEQLRAIKKMGPLEDILGMLPGMGQLKGMKVDEKELVHIEAIVQSMTRTERANPRLMDGSRRRRIAKGSGTTIQQVNHLLRDFETMKKMAQGLGKGRFPGLAGIR
jgi:signal recognition particle subunit SRP54